MNKKFLLMCSNSTTSWYLDQIPINKNNILGCWCRFINPEATPNKLLVDFCIYYDIESNKDTNYKYKVEKV